VPQSTGDPAGVDLFADEYVADPDPVLRALRENAPVHHDERTGLWLVSRYTDVRAALADPVVFHPGNALTAITPISGEVMRVLARAGKSVTLPPSPTTSRPGSCAVCSASARWTWVISTATRMSGVDIPAGAQVLLMLAGTGSDPEVFADPEPLCPGRKGARRHLAFDYGRHLCLGAGLARLEAAEVLRAVTTAIPEVTLVDPDPPMLGLLSFRAPVEVLVRARTADETSRPGA